MVNWAFQSRSQPAWNYENMSENRKGYNNFRLNRGVPEYGQKVSCAATNAI